MHAPQVTLQSVTGVDVELRIAGAGSRSYAFVIDWHIRLILALAWFIVATVAYFGQLVLIPSQGTRMGEGYALVVLLPTAGIYFLYHLVLEIAMRGRTPGKRIAGVRIVTRTGDIPSIGALLLRNVFRLIDSMPFAYLIGLATVVFTEQHVRIGDLAAGTLLIVDRDESESSFARLTKTGPGGLSPQAADLVHELMDRWTALDDHTRANIARSLIARLDKSITAQELASMNSGQLYARLVAFVKGPAA